MEFNIRGSLKHGYNIFLYKGEGKTLKSSYVFIQGAIATFKDVRTAEYTAHRVLEGNGSQYKYLLK